MPPLSAHKDLGEKEKEREKKGKDGFSRICAEVSAEFKVTERPQRSVSASWRVGVWEQPLSGRLLLPRGRWVQPELGVSPQDAPPSWPLSFLGGPGH